LPAADGQCQYYCGKLPNPIAQDSAWTFLSGSLFKVHCSAFFSPCSPWRFFVDDGRSHEHNNDRIRFNHSTGSVSIRPDTSRPTANAIGYAEFYSRSHDAVIRVYDAAGNVMRNGISKSASSDVKNTPNVQSMSENRTWQKQVEEGARVYGAHECENHVRSRSPLGLDATRVGAPTKKKRSQC
jgi:hypothetical protein